MNLAEDLRALLVSAVRKTPADKLPALLLAMMGEGIVEDRRGDMREEPRQLPAPKAKRVHRSAKRAAKTCPVPGCENAFSPRYGGYCAEHRKTAGFKAWESSAKRARGGAKKR